MTSLSVAVLFFLLSTLYLLCQIFKLSVELRKNLYLSIGVLMLLGGIVEIGMRSLDIYSTPSELNQQGYYYSVLKNEQIDSWFWVRKPNYNFSVVKKEFKFSRQTNSIGLSEREILPKKKNEFRILAIGDSFTEGEGVTYDSTWLNRISSQLNKEDSLMLISPINAGIGGCDPVYSMQILEKKLLAYAPDLVILSINGSDVMDISLRGGFERFKADGKVSSQKPPNWEWIYRTSYIFRAIIHSLFQYTPNLISRDQEMLGRKASVKILSDCCRRLVRISRLHNFNSLIVIHPLLEDFEKDRYAFMEIEQLKETLKTENIRYLDIREGFLNNGKRTIQIAKEYYWPINRHHNQKGYNIFGDQVYEKIIEWRLLEKDQ